MAQPIESRWDAIPRSLSDRLPIRPNWPLLLFVAMIPLQNIYIGKVPSLGAGLNFINIMIFLSLIVWKTRPECALPTDTKLHAPLYAYMAIFVCSSLYGILYLGVLGDKHFLALKDQLLPMFLFFVVLNSVRHRRGIVWMITATSLPLPYMFYVFRSQLSWFMSWHYTDEMRLVGGTFMKLSSNEIGAFYAAYTLVLAALFYYIKTLRERAVLAVLMGLNLYCLMYSQSRGSWIAFLGGLAVMGWCFNKKAAVAAGVAVMIFSSALLTIFPVSVQERFSTIFVEEGEERDRSAASRSAIWEIAFKKYKDSPVFGIGFHSFHHVNPYEGKDTHNYFVKVLTEQGAVGLLILLMIFWRSLVASRSLFSRTSDPLFKALGLGMLGCITAFMIGNMFGDRFSHYPLVTYFWVYLALVLRALLLCEAAEKLPKTNTASV